MSHRCLGPPTSVLPGDLFARFCDFGHGIVRADRETIAAAITEHTTRADPRRSTWKGPGCERSTALGLLLIPDWSKAGYLFGRDRASPKDGRTVFSKLVRAEMRSPVRVR